MVAPLLREATGQRGAADHEPVMARGAPTQGTKPVMNSLTYMRRELDCVWHIPYELATLRWRHLIVSKAMPRAVLIFQYVEAPTPSTSIRAHVNEMMTRFAGERCCVGVAQRHGDGADRGTA